MAEMTDDGQGENQLGVGDEPKTEKGGTPHGALGIVEETVDTGISQL
jgi:hypothetical protein